MVKSYCVKQKKITECVYNSDQTVTTSNDKMMIKCICSECGITKTKFVKQSGN